MPNEGYGTYVYMTTLGPSTCILKVSFNMQGLLKKFLSNNKLGAHYAMNAAELATALTILGCGGTAGLVAASEKAGWFTVPLVVAGLAVGFGFAYVVHKLAYRLLHAGGRQSGAVTGWAMLFAYTLVPMLVTFGAMAVTGWLAFLFVRHVL